MKRFLLAALGIAIVAFTAYHLWSQPPKIGGKRAAPPDNGGIQWFATWDSALAEAKRTVRPILLVSAAPHCAGVSGIW
jgi:hypothetical protein